MEEKGKQLLAFSNEARDIDGDESIGKVRISLPSFY